MNSKPPAKVSPASPVQKVYKKPEVVKLGALEQFRAIGLNFRDGSRYKDNP